MAIVIDSANAVQGTEISNAFTDTYVMQATVGNGRVLMLSLAGYSNQTGKLTYTTTYGTVAPTAEYISSRGFTGAHDSAYVAIWNDADIETAANTTISVTMNGEGAGPHMAYYIVEMTGIDQTILVSESLADTAANYDAGTTEQVWTPTEGGAIQFMFFGVFDTSTATTNKTKLVEIVADSGPTEVTHTVIYSTDGTVDGTLSVDANGSEDWVGLAFTAEGVPTVTTVDEEVAPAVIFVNQTAIVVAGTALDTGAETATITDSADVPGVVAQTGYAASGPTAATFNLTRGNLPTNTAGRTLNFKAINSEGASAAFEVQLAVEAGWSDIKVIGPITDSTSILSLLPGGTTAAANDVIEYETNSSAVSIAANGVVTCTSLPQTFSWRYWDESENLLTTTGTVTITEANVVGVEVGILNNVLLQPLSQVITRIFN